MHRVRRLTIPAIVLIALATAAPATAAPPTSALTARQAAFHDDMRKLWEDHVTWTRLAIVSFAAGLPDLQATEARLLANQTDIGNAIKPYYGRKAGNRLTALLREHILGAVALLQAAKSGDSAAITKASKAWYANANEIADFLHAANPSNWPRKEMRSMMKMHLDQTLKEAQDRLAGKFAADIRDYEAVHRHILEMADQLSDGIFAQFPQRFR
ncbi:MAG TPA: hypothetical protein VKB54_12560 [Solirubrobacteraceae bacterium]|nr:hypothetical protein [Solirubrobacteraceae bacterium]